MSMPTELIETVEAAIEGQKLALAKLISLFENQKSISRKQRIKVLDCLTQHPQCKANMALLLGITGTPGAGKSTLISRLSQHLLDSNRTFRIAVIGIDPSSALSGGALLGDRTRIRLTSHQDRFFFRSQSTNNELGGLTLQCFSVCRLLRYLFDLVIIETVGIGQNEIDIRALAEHTLLVLQPFAGDQIQFMKAGIMEIPDGFIVNKCDEERLAKQSYHALRTSLHYTDPKETFMTSAKTGYGIEALSDYIINLPTTVPRRLPEELNETFTRRWVQQQYGKIGLSVFLNESDAPEHSNHLTYLQHLRHSGRIEHIETTQDELIAQHYHTRGAFTPF